MKSQNDMKSDFATIPNSLSQTALKSKKKVDVPLSWHVSNAPSAKDSVSLESSKQNEIIPKRERVPEGLTIIYEAPQRRGKTLAGVIMSLDAHMRGRNVFSNIELAFPHKPLQFSETRLETGSRKFWNGHIFIDELNFFFDGRRSMSKENIEFSAFLLQQKKQGCNLTGTTHSIWSLDVRLRDNFDFLVTPSVKPPFPETPEVLKMEIVNGPLQGDFKKTIWIPVAKYLDLYDTFHVYNPFKG